MFRLMDVFLLEPAAHGTLTVFRAGLAILADNHDALLMSNFEGILSLLSKSALEQRYHDRADQLLKEVAKAASSVTAKRLEKYEKEYVQWHGHGRVWGIFGDREGRVYPAPRGFFGILDRGSHPPGHTERGNRVAMFVWGPGARCPVPRCP